MDRHAYFAGFFDGEGWITVATYKPRKRKKIAGLYQPPPKLVVGIGNNDPSVLIEIYKEFGGYFCRRKPQSNERPGNKGIYILSFYGDNLKLFLEKITPYLRMKKPLAELALEFTKTQRNRGSSNYFLTEDEKIKRSKIVIEIKDFRKDQREILQKEVI